MGSDVMEKGSLPAIPQVIRTTGRGSAVVRRR